MIELDTARLALEDRTEETECSVLEVNINADKGTEMGRLYQLNLALLDESGSLTFTPPSSHIHESSPLQLHITHERSLHIHYWAD